MDMNQQKTRLMDDWMNELPGKQPCGRIHQSIYPMIQQSIYPSTQG